MNDIDIIEITKIMEHQKDQPTIPLAPIYRIIKHETGKLVSQDAKEELHKIFYEVAKEVLEIANNLCDLMNRKTITGKILRVAYTTVRAQGNK